MSELLSYFPIVDPTWNFLVVLMLILFVPLVLERMRIPGIVGYILAGIAVGPNGLHVLEYDDSFEIFGKVGLYYIMFLASLEMNLQDVKKDKRSAFGYGLLSFILPFTLGMVANMSLLKCSLLASVLMASMYASHTLLTYPIVLRFGLTRRRSVNLAVGGTIVADTLTLLVLAVVGGMFKEDAGAGYVLLMLLKVVILGVAIVLIFPRLCRWFFRHYDDGVVQYIFVLGLVFLGAGIMESVGMEGILGAFLVGIVLNRAVPSTSPLMSHIEFVGNALFIPYFLISVGMIIDAKAMIHGMDGLEVAFVMVLSAALGKWLAARAGQSIYGLKQADGWLLFGLSNARAAATLAIMMVGTRIIVPSTGLPLLEANVVNGTMLLILTSCVLSSMVTDRAARYIMQNSESQDDDYGRSRHLLVALGHPEHTDPLINVALLMGNGQDNQVSAVSVITSDDAEPRKQAQKALDEATKIAAAANVEIHTQCRYSVNAVTGMSHSAKELDATDILIGLHRKQRLNENFFGRFAPDLIAATSQQVIIYRAIVPINTLRRIHLVVPRNAEHEPGFTQWADRIAELARVLGVKVYVYSGHDTLSALRQYWKKRFGQVQADYINYSTFETFQPIASSMRQDHMVVIIAARPGMPSHEQSYLTRLPEQMERYFSTRSLMIIYPPSWGSAENRPRMLSLSVK